MVSWFGPNINVMGFVVWWLRLMHNCQFGISVTPIEGCKPDLNARELEHHSARWIGENLFTTACQPCFLSCHETGFGVYLQASMSTMMS